MQGTGLFALPSRTQWIDLATLFRNFAAAGVRRGNFGLSACAATLPAVYVSMERDGTSCVLHCLLNPMGFMAMLRVCGMLLEVRLSPSHDSFAVTRLICCCTLDKRSDKTLLAKTREKKKQNSLV